MHLPFDPNDELPEVPYLSKDDSVLYPIMKKRLWLPIVERLPERISANTFTLMSNFGSILTFVAAIVIGMHAGASPLWFLVPAFGIFFYFSLDNMDGMQARRTNTSTPMGEFLDHWFDSFNIGLVSLAILITLELPPLMILALLALACVAFFTQFWEQRESGWLICGPFGSIEGGMITVGMYLLLAVTGSGWILDPVAVGWPSVAFFVALASGIGYLGTPYGCVKRVGRMPTEMIPLLIVLAASFGWYAVAPSAFFLIATIVLLANAYLSGRIIISRVTGSAYRGMDYLLLFGVVAPILSGLLLSWSPTAHLVWGGFVVFYLAIRLWVDFTATVTRLEGYLKRDEFLSSAVSAVRVVGRRFQLPARS